MATLSQLMKLGARSKKLFLKLREPPAFRSNKLILRLAVVSLDSIISNGSIIVSRGDSIVSELDIARLNETIEDNLPGPEIVNKRILHTIPQTYYLDGKALNRITSWVDPE